MWPEITTRLRSARRAERIDGWTQLRQDFTGSQTQLSQEQREKLSAILLDETDDGVWRMGVNVMLGLPSFSGQLPTATSTVRPRDNDSPLSLAQWLWQPFKRKSAVFSLTDPHYRRRDEVAIIPLARHLCRHDFPKTEFHFMQLDDPRWDRLLFDKHYQSLCFVGRMGIFGDEAARRWGNKACRFGFSLDHRPEGLKACELHPEYHCVTEKLADGSAVHHRTNERGGTRFDFGLVQRYLVRDGARHVPVLACAGGSALGTLAATMWATQDLAEPMHPADTDPIPMPPGLDVSSPFEALIHVTADITSYAWQPKHIELRSLFAGKHVWSVEDRSWQPLSPKRVALVREGDQVVALRFDGELASLRPNSESFRLLVRIFEGALKRKDGVVDIAKLAQDPFIWKDKKRTEQHVRNRLSNLKHRYLHDCLVIDETVTLTAEVTQEDKESA